MKIERINENQIRCTLTNFDLSMRNLHVNDLAYGTDKTGSLFREMIQRASREVGFDAEDIPLMVEAIPMANESVMLIITKMDDPEELDTRFSRFSPADEEDEPAWASLATEILEGADHLFNLFGNSEMTGNPEMAGLPNPADASADTPAIPAGSMTGSIQPIPSDSPQYMRIYLFENLDQVCAAAKQTGHLFGGSSILYKNPSNGKFYLILKKEDSDEQSFHRTCNILSEYASRQRYDAAVEAYYSEHYELFVRKNALKSLSVL